MDFEKEENWLNEMCANGYALKEISKGYYIFEECEPNQFTYRLNYVGTAFKLPNVDSYLNFIKDLDIEPVAESGPWVYFRRISTLGPFNLFSDMDSKIKHYIAVTSLWYFLCLACLPSGISLASHTIKDIISEKASWYMIILDFIPLLLSVLFFIFSIPNTKKIIKLRKTKKIHE